MAAIFTVVSKRMVISFLEGTVKIVILTAICRLSRGDMARGSPGMKLMRLARQFQVEFRPL